MDAFRAKMAALQKASEKEAIVFEVIPGAGHHSKNKAVIKPKIIDELTNMKVRFEEKNAGSINVFLGKASDDQVKTSAATPATSAAAKDEAKMEDVDITTDQGDAPNTAKFGCCIVM